MHPLLVDYPLGGRRFLLHWWTYDDRGHVVIADTERSLVATARRVFSENPDAEIKAMCEIEIVAPSEKFEKLAAEHQRRNSVNAFHFMMCYRVRESLEDGGLEPPALFAFCDEFEPDEEDDSDEEWAKENHVGCKNCRERIRLVSLTPEELHDRYAEGWYEFHPDERPSRLGPKKVESRAVSAKDDDELWCARSHFGHHAGGVELHEVDFQFFDHENIMFFFKRLRELDPAEMTLILAGEKEKMEKLREQHVEERKEEFTREKRERHEDIIRFFKERA